MALLRGACVGLGEKLARCCTSAKRRAGNGPLSLRLRRGARITRAASSTQTSKVPPREQIVRDGPNNNVSDHIYEKMGAQLHNIDDQPLGILKNAIYEFFDERFGEEQFHKHDDMPPVVSVKANFDEVLVPEDHVSRSLDDTFYIDQETVLRCHTTAHQAELLRHGERNFLVTGDVYRRDSIDSTHYPVFHQMEGVRVFTDEEVQQSQLLRAAKELAQKDLKETLEALAKHLFGDVETRWVDAYFPFTDPSLELEIYYEEDWMEVLGCGVMQQQILEENQSDGRAAWAFGLGLERLAMILFSIPDIRLFWTQDSRFKRQFDKSSFKGQGEAKKFEPFSKYPPVPMDVSFWLPEDGTFTENALCEVVRSEGGDLVEEVKQTDDFFHPKKQRRSNTFRIVYRSMERSLTTEEVNDIQFRVRQRVEQELGVQVR